MTRMLGKILVFFWVFPTIFPQESDCINNTETMWQNGCRPRPNFHLLSSVVLLWEAEIKPEMEDRIEGETAVGRGGGGGRERGEVLFKWRVQCVLEDLISRLKPDKDKLSLWLWGALFPRCSSPLLPSPFHFSSTLLKKREKTVIKKDKQMDGKMYSRCMWNLIE